MHSTDAILGVEAVSKKFAGVAALQGVALTVRRHSLTALIGPNGAGKSTLFDVISGFTRADGGSVTFDGRLVTGARPDELARLGLVRTFQSTRVFGRLSVLDNVLLGARHHPGESLFRRTFTPGTVRRRERELRARATALLDVVGLTRMSGEYAATLSGGQRKLLELARALMSEPRMLLLDEPAAGVNPTLANQIIDHVQRLIRDEGLTCLLVEHDMQLVMSRSDHVVVMNQGEVICDGPPERVKADRAVVDAYLGAVPAARTSDGDGHA